MGIAIGSSFDVQTALPLDSRLKVANLTARDAMSSLIRYEGMIVYVIAAGTNYQLVGGIANSNWAQLSGGGGGGGSSPSGTAFTIANNQSTPANVTGLVLDNTTTRSAKIEWQVWRSSVGGLTRIQAGAFYGTWNGTAWTLTDCEMSQQDAGVVFSIVSGTGQVQYISDDNTGTYNATNSVLTWQIVKASGL